MFPSKDSRYYRHLRSHLTAKRNQSLQLEYMTDEQRTASQQVQDAIEDARGTHRTQAVDAWRPCSHAR